MLNSITEFKSLNDIVTEKNVISINKINNKKQLFIEISNLLKNNTYFSQSSLCKILLSHENAKPTNLGGGLAIPNIQHTKIIKLSGCFIKLNTSIIYDSLNNDPVDLIFVLLSPIEVAKNHIRMLAKISRLLKDIDIQNRLRGAENNQALFEILIQTDLI